MKFYVQLILILAFLTTLLEVDGFKHRHRSHLNFKQKLHSHANQRTREQSESDNINITTDTRFMEQEPALMEGWLKLAEKNLRDTNRFPPLPLKSGHLEPIRMWGDMDNTGGFLNKGSNAAGGRLAGQSVDPRQLIMEKLTTPELDMSTTFRVNTEYGKKPTVPHSDSFYFTLTKDNLYFKESPEDFTVLGATAIYNIRETIDSKAGMFCFGVTQIEKDLWTMCADDAKTKKDWVCAINTLLGRPCGQAGPQIIKKQKLVRQPLIIVPIPSPFCNEKWNYNDLGKDWNCKCGEGYEQSPVDLPDSADCNGIMNNVNFDYKMVKDPKIRLEQNMLRIEGDWGYMLHDEITKGLYGLQRENVINYKATEVVFKTPSDHTIKGKQYPLEVQIIHKATSKGDLRYNAVVSFLFEQRPGTKNAFIDSLNVMDLPNIYVTERQLSGRIDLFPLMQYLPDQEDYRPFSYYLYHGSIPHPPCSEPTLFLVRQDVQWTSYTSLDLLRDVFNPPALGDAGDGCESNKMNVNLNRAINPEGNNRAIQDLKGREIYFYDGSACEPKFNKPLLEQGHYKKIIQDTNKYIYVEGDRPSGIPNAFVVDMFEAKGLRDDKATMAKKMQDYAKGFFGEAGQSVPGGK